MNCNIFYGVMGLLLMSTVSGIAWADCKNTYPDSQVDAELSKPEYLQCSLETMKSNYTDIVEEQTRLLTEIRPAYLRHLKQTLNSQQQDRRLREYDEELRNLIEIAAQITDAPLIEDPDDISQKKKNIADLKKLFEKSMTLSKVFKNKTTLNTDIFDSGELIVYCKLNFNFRINTRLHKETITCLKKASEAVNEEPEME